MEPRISAIPLVVTDKSKALEYYTQKVGFEKKTDYTQGAYRYITVGPRGQDLELAFWEAGSPDPAGWIKSASPGGPPIVMMVDDCKKAFEEMKSRGVQFKQDLPEKYPWGITATFSDPDGNLFSINQLYHRSS